MCSSDLTTSPTHLLLPHGAHPLHNLPLTRSRCHALAGDGSHPLCFTLVLPWARTAIPCVPPLRPRATTAALIFHNLNLAAPAPPFTTSVSRLTSVPAFHCSGLALSRHSAATFLLPTAFFFHSMVSSPSRQIHTRFVKIGLKSHGPGIPMSPPESNPPSRRFFPQNSDWRL